MTAGWIGIVVGLMGCVVPDERPQATVVCHNANCAHATNPAADDTLQMLDDSLALEYRGRSAIDGIEVDTLWDRQRSLCIFAHDFGAVPAVPELGIEAAMRIARHLRDADEVSWSGDRFFVKIELKGEVLADNTQHDDAEVEAHLDCVFDMAQTIIDAARARGIALELGFDSMTVSLLRAAAKSPRWPGKSPYPDVELRLISNMNYPGLEPSDLESLRDPGNGDGIDILAFHATRTPNGIVRSYAELGAALMLWMNDVAPETFDAVHHYEPPYIVTNEALLVRRWTEQ